MKESKGVYVTKRTMNQDFQRACGNDSRMRVKQLIASCEVKRYGRATQEMGLQVDVKKDLGCTCRLAGTRHLNERYFNAAEQIYAYHGLRGFTNTGVGSIRALPRKRVRKIYLPETVDRGVGDTEMSSSFFQSTSASQEETTVEKKRRKKLNSKYKCTRGSNYGAKETSSKCVGGVPDLSYPVVNVKLSPIIKCNCVTTGSEMPRSSEEKNIEISTQGTHTEDKKYIATTTQVQMTPTVADAPVDPISILNAAEEVKDMPKEASKSRQRNKTLVAKAKAREEEKFSSDSLVQHIHDLECPSKMSRPSDDPVMENKIEREYRQIFATKSKSNQDQPSQDNRSTSLLRRRFEALRRGRKKEEPRNTVELVSSSPTSLASHKDVSIASDPPSLEARSYSRPSAPYKTVASPTYDRTSYRRSVTGKKDRDRVPSIHDDNELAQGVSGMFKLWGKKFNLDDQKKTVKADDNSKIEESVDEITGDTELPPTESKEVERKTGGRKFSFFNKRSKDKTKCSYKSKKGVTTNRCEVKNGLLLKMTGTSKPQGSGVAETKKQPEAISTEKYDETLRKAWLKKFLTSTIDSRDSVKIRWNNATYTTSSSTVFELMDNVYKHTGIVIRSKSDITTNKPKKSNNKRVNFIHQNIEAWMMPKTIPDKPMTIPIKIKSTPDKDDTKSIEVSLTDQKWSIDTAKTYSHKIELVLHSNNVVQLTNKVSSDFLRIDIPKGFFSDSTTGDEDDHQCRTSDEEVYKIVEYETLKSNSEFRKKGNFNTDDYASNEITVTVKVKDSENVESKVLETVIKKPSTQRDVVTQGSDVYFPKRCDVIGVGITTQRDAQKMKPISNIQNDLSEEESDPTTYSPKKNCEYAQNYLQDYYRQLMPQGIDVLSWCVNDSNDRIYFSGKNSAVKLNHGDGSKSCSNIYEELNAPATQATIEANEAVTDVSSYMTLSSHGGTNFDEEINNNSKIFFGRFCRKKRPKEQCAAVDKDTCEEKCKPTSKTDENRRVFPKDSVEVFRKRKIYAVSQNKSKWGSSSNSQGGSLPSLHCKKPCCKSVCKKKTSNSKHVIVTKPCPSPPEPCHSPPKDASCLEISCPGKNSQSSELVCQSRLTPCPHSEPPSPPREPGCLPSDSPCPPSEPPSYPTKESLCPPRKLPCPPSKPLCPPSEPFCLPSILSNQSSKPPCPGDCPHSKPSSPHSNPHCQRSKPPSPGDCPPVKTPSPPSKPSCLACIMPYKTKAPPCSASLPRSQLKKSPCPTLVPLCLPKKRPSNALPPALKKLSSDSKDKPNCGHYSKSPLSNDIRRFNKIKINTNAFEIDETIKLKCNKPPFPVLPCTSPPSLCAAVTPVSPSEADTPFSSNNSSKHNRINKRCLTPPPPNVNPKMRSISPVTSLLNSEKDTCFPKVRNKTRLCSMFGCKKCPINKPLSTLKASGNKKSVLFNCKNCMTPPCSDETDTSTSSENEGSPQMAPTMPVVCPSRSPCQCCLINPPAKAGLCQNDASPSYQSQAPCSCPRANQPKLCPVSKMSLAIAKRPPSPPSYLKEGPLLKQFIYPPSFPLIRKFAENRLASQPSLTPYHLSTNQIASHPPCFTDRSVEKQSSSPCSLPADRQCTKEQFVPRPSFPPYHPCTNRPKSHPTCSPNRPIQNQPVPPPLLPPNRQCAANQLATPRPSSPTPDYPSTNRSVSPPASVHNHLNLLPPHCQMAVNQLASRRSLLSTGRIVSPPSSSSKCQFIKQQSTPPSSPPNLRCTQQSPCPTHGGSMSYTSLIKKSVSPTSAPCKKKSVSLSPCPPSISTPEKTCKECSSPAVETSNQTDTAVEYPPLNQSSPAYIGISKCCSQCPVTDTNRSTTACMSSSSKPDCPVCSTITPLPSPKASQNIKSKLAGFFLRKLPSMKKTNPQTGSDDGKRYNVKVNEHNSDSHSGIREMKLQDEDGLTLCERTEYKKRSRSIHRASVAGDVYETANVCHRVSTNTSDLKINSNSKHCILPDDSSPSLANLVEIQLKMKVTQGDKITEINIGNGGDSEKEVVKPQPSRDVYVVNKASEPVTVSHSPGNDIDIRIIIKNFKNKNKKVTRRKIKKESVIDEFTRKISEKFHTVSTGYSDIEHSDADPTGVPGNAVSIHRATWDLTCESDDKEKTGKISREQSDYSDKETTNVNTNTTQSATTLTDFVMKDDEIPEKPLVLEKSCFSLNLSVIKSDISNNEEGESNVVNDDTDQSAGVEIDIVSSSDTTRREKTPRAEKKKMLKMVIAKAGRIRHKNKDKVSKITKMLKTILTSDSSDHVDMTFIKNDLAKDITYASLPPSILRDTDSMNNFFKISNMMSESEDKCDRLNTSRDTVMSYADELPAAAETCGGAGGVCLCNVVATKLGLCNSGCCCQSKKPEKADIETNCDMRTDEDMFLLNYGASNFIDQETQRSRLFCSKANSVNVTYFKSVLSNELDILNVSKVKTFSSNNLGNSSQEETKMIKKASTPEALNNVLNLSDEDKIIVANMEPTKYKIETMYTEVTHRKEPKDKVKLNHVAPADILQSYETKKAVLEMYTERTLSKGGERLVAKLPKFSLENESDIIKYEKICTRSLIFSLKR